MLGTLGCEQHFDLGGKALALGCVLLSCSVLCWGCLPCSMCSALIPASRWPVTNGTKLNIVVFLSNGTDAHKGGGAVCWVKIQTLAAEIFFFCVEAIKEKDCPWFLILHS